MQATSPTYNPYPDARFSELEAAFKLIDTTAQADAVPFTAQIEAFSKPQQLIDDNENTSVKWASFETDGWPIDGSCKLWGDDLTPYQMGVWTLPSDNTAGWAVNPTITFTFSQAHSSAAFTVCFDDKMNWYPQEMIISAYDGSGTLIISATSQVSSVKQVVRMNTPYYRKVVIEFTKTRLPYQRVRVTEVIFGVVETYNRHNLSQASIKYQLTPDASSFPSAELNITFDNSEKYYNFVSPNSVYAFLEQTQPLDVRIGVGKDRVETEYINCGRFYFTSSGAEDGTLTARITAHDQAYQLDNRVYRGGSTGTWTVAQALTAVINSSGLHIDTIVPSHIALRTINRCIPKDTKHREAIRLIAQAARCMCYFNRFDQLVFAEPVIGSPIDCLDHNNMPQPAQVTVGERFNTIELTVRNSYANTETLFTSSNPGINETIQTRQVANPLAYEGQQVADWLLLMSQNRINYRLLERGNPAREIADTVKIYDNYGENKDAMVTGQSFIYDGALSAESVAWR